MRHHLLILLLVLPALIQAQTSALEFRDVAPLPEAVANNAVAAAKVNGQSYVYSFSGIDSRLDYTGIHLKTFKYDVDANTWSQLADVPNNRGVVAAGASNVKGRIYVIGGYHVFANGSEESSNYVGVFNPVTDAWEANATPIPFAIDDHVQAVWQDSLIYVITGWHNNANWKQTQIYNPSTDTWTTGTNVPFPEGEAFGASGEIIGNTIYYIGGADDAGQFPLTNYLRVGHINPSDPTDITWEVYTDSLAIGYRMAAMRLNDQIYWAGGSLRSYNYDGKAYTEGSQVYPSHRMVTQGIGHDSSLVVSQYANVPMMDYRGFAKTGLEEGYLVGGIDSSGQVSNRVFHAGIFHQVGIAERPKISAQFQIAPNPVADVLHIETKMEFDAYRIMDVHGKVWKTGAFSGANNIDIADLQKGLYLLEVEKKGSYIGFQRFTKK